MRQILAMKLAVLLSAGAVGAQDYAAGIAAYSRGNYTTALKEWRPLAENGDAPAQFQLGFLYDSGRGVAQDYTEAARWYRLAADQGYGIAQNNLGVLYDNGEGSPQTSLSAHMWFNIACANGHENGCNNRKTLAAKMTPAEISEAQRRARVCMESGYKDCD